MLCAIAVTFGYSRYATKVGREIGSPSLVADARHIRVDMFGSVAVLAGLLSSLVDINLDRITAFIIVVIIVWSGGKILIDGIRVLLDASLDYQTLSRAEKLIMAEPRVMEIQNLMGRNSGRYKFIEANIVLKAHELDQAHFITNRIESRIKREIKNVDRVLIHYEPIRKQTFVYALPLEDEQDWYISDHFGEAAYFGLFTVKISTMEVIAHEIVTNPFTRVEHGKGILVAEFLARRSIDVIITREAFGGRGPYYVFSNAAIDNIITQEETVRSALARLGIDFPE